MPITILYACAAVLFVGLCWAFADIACDYTNARRDLAKRINRNG